MKLALLFIAITGLVIGSVVLAGVAPAVAFQHLWDSNFATSANRNDLLKEVTPLLMLGGAVFVALKAGLFNIGAEGQFIVGAIGGTAVALNVPGPFGILLASAFGAACGALWAFPAAWIRAYRGGHEVITTIMLNNVALQITALLVAGPLKDPGQQGTTTKLLPESSKLPFIAIGELSVNWAIVVSVLLACAGAYWFSRFVSGYELRAVGANPIAAKVAGISTPRVQLTAFCASGALAGLAGAFQVLAYEGRFFKDFSPGYGFDALGVALLAGPSMIGVIPAAIGFGILNNGRTALSLIGVPKGITSVILGLLIIVVASLRYRKVKSHE